MLDPEALRSREIGDDPYAPTGAAKKSPMRLFSSNADELEWQFQQRVTDLAEANGWEWHHQRNSIGSRKGWPDLALWRPACIGQPGRFLLRELKRDGERPRPEQLAVVASLRLAGVDANFWWQADWPEIEATLSEDAIDNGIV